MSESKLLSTLDSLLGKAKAAGAEAADAVVVEGTSLSVAFRLGQPEKVERSEGGDIGLRVFIGKRQAIVSSADRSEAALAELAERAVAMAREVPEDPHCGLADPDQIARDLPKLDSCDPEEPTAPTLVEWARRAEDAARAVDGVTNSEGAEAAWGKSRVAMAATNGFANSYEVSSSTISASVLAGGSDGMERDYDYSSAVYASDLRSPEDIGRSAGERTVRRMGARKMPTGKLPVVFDPRISGGLLGHLAGAINGGSIARGTSFLKDKMGQQVFPKGFTVIDDPHRQRGLRSKPCDGEGLANRRRAFIEDGVLTSWVLDLRSARQLGLQSTGHASRGTGGPPSPSITNFYLEPGKLSRSELIADIKQGFYVVELIGMGVNGVTGDYSRGAAGYWIENGEITFPVNEMTVASNLKDMFLNLTAADDLVFRTGVDAPTLRIEGMTLAGA
ncbi:MAG TPA: metallopeptidase TldD-related protein [Magnetospirillaceae bacterium]|nr:metallopeptidase TldD-related protein [Magnetospirillaceae bacterium]